MATTALRAMNFTAGIGVNIRLSATNTNYWDQTTVLADLQYLGINHVRDAVLDSASSGQGSYGILAAAGIKFDFMVEPTPGLSQTLPLLDAFAAAHPGAITGIEGPNEIDYFTPFTYNGLSGLAAATSFQSALFTAVNADTNLASIPVLNFSEVFATAVGQADQANIHLYPSAGSQPYATLAAGLARQQAAMPSVPVALTETGFSNANYADGPLGPGGVNELAQAKLTLNAVMDATLLGFSQIDLYQLLDAASDPAGTNPQDHSGLFDNNGVAKPVAVGLHNMMSILADRGATAATFTPGMLNYTITGMPSTAHSYLIEKSSGVYDLVLWNETPVWNPTTDTSIWSPTAQVTVNLGATFGSVAFYDTLSGTTPVYTAQNTNHVGVTLVDHPLILEISTSTTPATIVNTPLTDTATPIMFLSGGTSYYVVTASTDVINNPVGGATQAVQASCSYVLPANLTSLTLTGTGNFTATGNSGTDSIVANSGADTLIAGSGSDHLFAGAGADTLIGGSGTTIFMPGTGIATMVGGSGTNTFYINSTADVVQAQAGAVNNTIESSVSFTAPANVGSLYLTGTANLTATANAGTINLFANSGNDTLTAGAGSDHLFAGAGADTLIGGSGTTIFTASTGVATMVGGTGTNYFYVNSTADVVQAHAGAVNNTINSSVSLTAPVNVGSLYLTGTANLTATANSGTINLFANSGADTLIGGSGATNLFGGAGGDTFIAGTGATMMNAGAGADKFVFQSVADTGTVSHPDIITGFTSGQDVVDLSAIAHTALGAGHSLTYIGSAAFTHVAGQVDYTLSSSGLTLQGDLNGDGVADFSILLSHTTAIAAGHDLVLG